MKPPRQEHPQQELLFVILGGRRPNIEQALERLLDQIRDARAWTLGPPEFVELVDEGLIGGALKLYSALPPWRERLQRDVDVLQMEEASFLIERLARFSAENDLDVEFELDGTSVRGDRERTAV